MDRRTVLKGMGAAGLLAGAGGFPMPALSQGAAARTLRFVPQADLASIDPIWTTAFDIRNHGYPVYDTLFGTDAEFTVRPQMAEGADRRATTAGPGRFRLREGLRFHDDEPVRAHDCREPRSRWSARDRFGQTWAARSPR